FIRRTTISAMSSQRPLLAARRQRRQMRGWMANDAPVPISGTIGRIVRNVAPAQPAPGAGAPSPGSGAGNRRPPGDDGAGLAPRQDPAADVGNPAGRSRNFRYHPV